eukprot:m.217534 g.217534  ORF g.217534 m.217534 type:complete len:64 (+) comp19129_c0_seq3:667-858(+)
MSRKYICNVLPSCCCVACSKYFDHSDTSAYLDCDWLECYCTATDSCTRASADGTDIYEILART